MPMPPIMRPYQYIAGRATPHYLPDHHKCFIAEGGNPNV